MIIEYKCYDCQNCTFFEISKRFYKKLKQSYWLFFLVYVCVRVYIYKRSGVERISHGE